MIKPDPITLKRIEKLHPILRTEAKYIYLEICKKNVFVRFTHTLRTFAEQQILYNQGRSKPGKVVTNAKPGSSFHNYGLAIDFCLLLNGGKAVSWNRNLDIDEDGKKDWLEVVEVFKKYGWTWGGDWSNFKDYPHFEKSFGLKTSELKKLLNANHVIKNEDYKYIKL